MVLRRSLGGAWLLMSEASLALQGLGVVFSWAVLCEARPSNGQRNLWVRLGSYGPASGQPF